MTAEPAAATAGDESGPMMTPFVLPEDKTGGGNNNNKAKKGKGADDASAVGGSQQSGSRHTAHSLDDFPVSEPGGAAHDDDDYDTPFSSAKNDGSGEEPAAPPQQSTEILIPPNMSNFKPASGCTNASDYIVRCFSARLRSGITVVKHGRSRWCKSRLRVIAIDADNRSLSWKPDTGEPPSSKPPPKLDLANCIEVRHAWSADPQNPKYTGTAILRQKCEAANAHKSFALIFKARTVDITALTGDQCKVLMEGFSALCYRLQAAKSKQGGAAARPMPDEEIASTTASNTLTSASSARGVTKAATAAAASPPPTSPAAAAAQQTQEASC